ncbi:CHD5-like protein-domain-containing protein [Nemania diffusa]|nr:CHD5-like protein-domain-containing protein [Nemania diffusa]
MPSLLLVVLLVEVTVHLVNTIGAATINNLLWNIYLALPTPVSKQAAEKNKLQKEYLAIRRDLNATSSQDRFAKWAKLRRQHDKQLQELEKMKASYEASKAKFDRTAGIIRWCATSGVKFILPWIYGKEPMFWLPNGWFPYYVEWILSFPRAPLGSISIVSWQTACAAAVLLFSDAIITTFAFAVGAKPAQKQPVTPTTGEKGPPPASAQGNSEKEDIPFTRTTQQYDIARIEQSTMVSISWGTIKSLLIFFGPILLPKAIGYYQSLRASSKAANQPIRPLPASGVRALSILCTISLVLLILALPPFAPENLFRLTSSRLQIPTDVLFNRLTSLRPNNALTQSDGALRARFVNLESRLLYLQYGPDVLASCPFCISDEPKTYLYYALPALAAPHLLNLIALSLATSGAVAGPEAARWRRTAAMASAVVAGLDAWSVSTYNYGANARAARLVDLEMFFWTARALRLAALGLLDLGVAALIYVSATNRLFAAPPDAAARVDAVTRQLLATKSRLSAVGIVKNTSLRDEDLRARTAAYWMHEGHLMREVMEDREVIEGVNDALSNRINIQDISRDAENYALNMLPQPVPQPQPPAPESAVG